jgi:hypothetical protein
MEAKITNYCHMCGAHPFEQQEGTTPKENVFEWISDYVQKLDDEELLWLLKLATARRERTINPNAGKDNGSTISS